MATLLLAFVLALMSMSQAAPASDAHHGYKRYQQPHSAGLIQPFVRQSHYNVNLPGLLRVNGQHQYYPAALQPVQQRWSPSGGLLNTRLFANPLPTPCRPCGKNAQDELVASRNPIFLQQQQPPVVIPDLFTAWLNLFNPISNLTNYFGLFPSPFVPPINCCPSPNNNTNTTTVAPPTKPTTAVPTTVVPTTAVPTTAAPTTVTPTTKAAAVAADAVEDGRLLVRPICIPCSLQNAALSRDPFISLTIDSANTNVLPPTTNFDLLNWLQNVIKFCDCPTTPKPTTTTTTTKAPTPTTTPTPATTSSTTTTSTTTTTTPTPTTTTTTTTPTPNTASSTTTTTTTTTTPTPDTTSSTTTTTTTPTPDTTSSTTTTTTTTTPTPPVALRSFASGGNANEEFPTDAIPLSGLKLLMNLFPPSYISFVRR